MQFCIQTFFHTVELVWAPKDQAQIFRESMLDYILDYIFHLRKYLRLGWQVHFEPIQIL